MPAIELRRVRKNYTGGIVGLEETDLEVARGERFAILGPSGAGKSTLLRLIAGLEEPDAGEIYIEGKRANTIPPHLRGIGWLSQTPALYPQLCVREQLSAPKHATSQAVPLEEAAALLGLETLLERYPRQLSGGEKQRVALARLLIRGAPVWLLDEPFAHLDPIIRDEFRHDLHLLLDRTFATILLVTHDTYDATATGRRIGVLGQGRFRQIGTPVELRICPGNRFVAFCLGEFRFVGGKVVSVATVPGEAGAPGDVDIGTLFASDCGTVHAPLPVRLRDRPAGMRLMLGLRQEDVRLMLDESGEKDSGPIRGRGWCVVSAVRSGSAWRLGLARGRSQVWAEWRTGSPPAIGTPADWTITGEGTWFDADTGERV